MKHTDVFIYWTSAAVQQFEVYLRPAGNKTKNEGRTKGRNEGSKAKKTNEGRKGGVEKKEVEGETVKKEIKVKRKEDKDETKNVRKQRCIKEDERRGSKEEK